MISQTFRRVSPGRRLLAGLLPPLVLFVIYVPVVSFPYFWDDLYILNWVHSVPPAEMLTRMGFFRFRVFDRLLFLVSFDLLGPLGATVMHFLSLALAMVNAALVARIAGGLAPAGQRRFMTGTFAGLAFALYPASYRNLAGAAAIAHLAVTAATLMALALAAQFMRTGRGRWLVLSLLMAGLAPLAAETGVVTGFITAGCVGLQALPRPGRRAMQTMSLHGATSMLLTGGVALVTRGGVAANSSRDLWNKALFFLQALTYPAAPTIRWLTAQSVPALLATALIGFAALVVLAGLLLRSPNRGLFVFGLLWFGMASAVPWYALTFDYLLNAPQVYYFGSAGAAMVWAALLGRGLAARMPIIQRLALSLGLVYAAANAVWISRRFHLYELGVQPLSALARAADEHPDARLLVVNLPGSLSWPTPFFPIGNEGAIMLSDESPASLFVRYNSRNSAAVQAVYIPDLQSRTPFFVGVHGTGFAVDALGDAIRAASAVYLAAYQPDQIVLREIGAVTTHALPRPAPVARFANGLTLDSVSFDVKVQATRLTLDWGLAVPPSGHDFFIHTFDCQGNVLALADGPAIGGLYPLPLWRPGDAVHDLRYPPLERRSADGCYTLEIGLFDTLSGRRELVFDSAGQPYPNDAITLTFP